MSTVAPPADQAADILQKLSLDSQSRTLNIPESTNKTAVYQYGAVDSNAFDPSVYYLPNGYQPYFYGGYGSEYTGYTNSQSVDMTPGAYGENASLVYPQGYGYAAYPYSPATSPAPQVGGDGQLYGAQQYQYPSYFPLTTSSGPFASSVPASTQSKHSTNKAANNYASAGASKGGIPKAINGSAPVKPFNQRQSALSASSNLYGNSALASGYQDPRFSYDGYYTPVSWHDGSNFSEVQRSVSGSGVASSYSKANNVPASRNQNYRSNSRYTSLHQPASMTGYAAQGSYNRVYPNRSYGHYGSTVRSGMGYGSSGYDSRTNERGWVTTENRYRSRGRGNDYFYGNENIDGLNELNRGPRGKGTKNKDTLEVNSEEVKKQSGDESNVTTETEETVTCVVPDREEYNKEDFPVEYKDAMFFIIKSYSEDDVHKSIKYNVWASTPNGNKKLDAAYQQAQQRPGGCPVFLFFSVNGSGQFVGVAEMIGPVDFNKSIEYWQQDKWTGSFPLKWHIVKDVPNSLLKHITLENNENKPVTNSRDTQEVKLEQGLNVIKIFKEHNSKTCILDDFSFYADRQKTILEKKAKQQRSQKQVWEGKTNEEEKKTVTAELAKESGLATQSTNVAETADFSNGD
uniref:YTH domain-containing family protein n=1 Tax=Noccaea caerulescens TaxID=107243 RepID=A0A1J3CUA1_NOCCA